MSKKLSTEEFINRSNKKHKDLYNYSQSVYVNSTNKVKIKCLKHGYFYQKPHDHFNGRGCEKCSYESNGKNRRKTTKDFIKKSKEIFGDRFGYLKTLYIKNNIPVIINCKKHGEFTQIPNIHLSNKSKGGCKKCKAESIKKINKTTDEFIEEAIKIHGNKYDYSLVNYKGVKSKVKIICKKHGIFFQQAYDHLQGVKCRKCANRGSTKYNIAQAERNKEKWINTESTFYILEFKSGVSNFIKIGVSINFKERLRVLKRETEFNVIDVILFKTNLYSAVIFEQFFMKNNLDYSKIPSIKFSGDTECFNIIIKEQLIAQANKFLIK